MSVIHISVTLNEPGNANERTTGCSLLGITKNHGINHYKGIKTGKVDEHSCVPRRSVIYPRIFGNTKLLGTWFYYWKFNVSPILAILT